MASDCSGIVGRLWEVTVSCYWIKDLKITTKFTSDCDFEFDDFKTNSGYCYWSSLFHLTTYHYYYYYIKVGDVEYFSGILNCQNNSMAQGVTLG